MPFHIDRYCQVLILIHGHIILIVDIHQLEDIYNVTGLAQTHGERIVPWGGVGGWAWNIAGQFGQSANHNPSTQIHSCILTDSILSKPRRRSFRRTSAKLQEPSS